MASAACLPAAALSAKERAEAIVQLLSRPVARLVLCDVIAVFSQQTLATEPLAALLAQIAAAGGGVATLECREGVCPAALAAMAPEASRLLQTAWRLRIGRKPADLGRPDAAPHLRNVKGVSPKKQHEVSRMATLLRILAAATGSRGVVDVGAGSGYLGLALVQPEGMGRTSQKKQRGKGRASAEGREAGATAAASTVAASTAAASSAAASTVATSASNAASASDAALASTALASTALASTTPAAPDRPLVVVGVEGSPLIHEGAGQRQQRPHLAAYSHRITSMHGRLEPGDAKGRRTVCQAALQRLARLQDASPAQECHARSPARGDASPPPPPSAPDAMTAIIAGVHACGDLTPSILRAFQGEEHLRAVACVGCCYQGLHLGSHEQLLCGGDAHGSGDETRSLNNAHLGADGAPPTDARPADDTRGFPLSRAVQECLKRCEATCIDRNALWRAASHQPRRQEAAEDEAWRVRATLLRAALDLALSRVPHLRVSNIKGRAPPGLLAQLCSSGGEVAADAYIDHVLRVATVQAAGAEGPPTPASDCVPLRAAIREALAACLRKEKELRALLLLQALFEALVEDLLALDRCLYLREALGREATVRLVPLFDEALSPRCYALVATRGQLETPLPAFSGALDV